jgi:signal transduction histidine kinase
LKNPLQHIGGYAAVLQDDCSPELDAVGQECLEAIVEAADKMTSIIDALLLLASVRQEEVNVEPLSMGAVVEAAVDRLRPTIQASRAEVAMPDAWPKALGYAPWVEEVWVNYISNAVKYGGRPDEGKPPQLRLGADRGAEVHRFWVRDRGRGLTAEEQSRLFQPFTRLGRTEAKGHGLGLSIVRRIVEKLGGGVSVESEKGEGSTFGFTLPARSEARRPTHSAL